MVGEDRFNECLEFTKEHNLYKEAMALFHRDSENYKVLFYYFDVVCSEIDY